MSNNTAKKAATSPADVVAQATEENLVVPTQKTADENVTVTKSDEQADSNEDQAEPKLSYIEGGKKTLKEKLSGALSKAGKHKKALLGTVAVVGVITLTAVKYAKKQAEKLLDETVSDESVEGENTTDETAA